MSTHRTKGHGQAHVSPQGKSVLGVRLGDADLPGEDPEGVIRALKANGHIPGGVLGELPEALLRAGDGEPPGAGDLPAAGSSPGATGRPPP